MAVFSKFACFLQEKYSRFCKIRMFARVSVRFFKIRYVDFVVCACKKVAFLYVCNTIYLHTHEKYIYRARAYNMVNMPYFENSPVFSKFAKSGAFGTIGGTPTNQP